MLKPSHLKLPLGNGAVATMDGTFVQTPEQRDAFVPLLMAKYPPEDTRVRNLTSDELTTLWYFIGWDLEDPTFIVEQGPARFAVSLDATGTQLRYIEDLSEPCLRAVTDDAEKKNVLSCHCMWIDNGKRTWVEASSCP